MENSPMYYLKSALDYVKDTCPEHMMGLVTEVTKDRAEAMEVTQAEAERLLAKLNRSPRASWYAVPVSQELSREWPRLDREPLRRALRAFDEYEATLQTLLDNPKTTNEDCQKWFKVKDEEIVTAVQDGFWIATADRNNQSTCRCISVEDARESLARMDAEAPMTEAAS